MYLNLFLIEWMNENNIHQWNETNYTDAYPLSYYEEKRKQVMKKKENKGNYLA